MDLNSIRDICTIGSLTYYFSVTKLVQGNCCFMVFDTSKHIHRLMVTFKNSFEFKIL